MAFRGRSVKLEIDGALLGSPTLTDLEAQVLADVNETLAERRRARPLLAQPFGAFLVCIAMWSEESKLALITLLATMSMVTLANYLILHFYFRDGARRRRVSVWRAWMVGGVAGTGLAWGLGIWFANLADPVANQFGLIALAAVVGAGGIAFSVMPAASISFVWLSLVPNILQSVYEFFTAAELTGSAAALAPLFVAYGLMMTGSCLKSGRDLRQLMLRHREAVSAEGRLERQIQARTRDLEARTYELLLERDRAIAASSAKTQFLASISHEFRTPLNSILGFAEAMRLRLFGEFGNSRYAEYVEDIYKSGRQLQEILDGLVALSHIESGRFVVRREAVDLSRVVEECLKDHAQLAESQSARVHVKVAEDARTLTADARALRLIVGNLLSNALRFGGEHGEVQIATRRESDDVICLYIADRGAGMNEEQISLALEPYQQIDGLLARRHKGAGLGLPIVRALVDLHGGRFCIESAIGKGTTVEVRLPRDQVRPVHMQNRR